MPSQRRQSAAKGAPAKSTPALAGTPAPEAATPARGNAAAQEKVAPAETGDAGLANYQAALGDFLGKELYKAVGDALAWDKVGQAANDAVHAALAAGAGKLGGLDGVEADAAALDALVAAVEGHLAPHLKAFLEGDGKALHGKLTGWVGANPEAVAGAALLAAAGAVIANVDLPTLKKSFKLREGLDADVEAQLGKIRAISLQKIRAKLSYKAGPLAAAVKVGHEDGKTSGELEATVGEAGRQLKLDAKADEDGLKLFGVQGELVSGDRTMSGGVSQARGGGVIGTATLVRKDGSTTRTDDVKYDAGSGVLSVGRAAITKEDELTISKDMRWNSDGTNEAGASMSYSKDGLERSFSARHATTQGAGGLTDEDRLTFGMKYTKDDLKVALDAAFSSTGTSSASGSVEKDLGDGTRYGADLKLADGKLAEAGAFYGFKDAKEFRSFLLDYRYKADIDEHTFGMVVERQIGDVMARWQQKATWGATGSKLDTSLHAAKYIDDDTALIAGGHHYKDFETGKSTFKPEVGVQYKGVPVLVGYDTERKAVTVGISIPFGR